MNVNSITNTAYSSYIPTGKKDKGSESFAYFLEAYSAGNEASTQVSEYTVSAEEIEAIEAETGEIFSNEPRYSVTDEEAEYFREKYGENYDEEHLSDFFYELAEKGIISHLDSLNATCCGFIIKVPPEEQPGKWTGTPMTHTVRYRLNDIKYMRSRNIFGEEYKDFKRDYDKEVITWEDFIQEQRDFYEYMRNRDTIYDAERKPRPNDPLVGYDERLEGLERAAGVIMQIFG